MRLRTRPPLFTYLLVIDSIHILFLLYLLLWSCFSTPKPARFHQNY